MPSTKSNGTICAAARKKRPTRKLAVQKPISLATVTRSCLLNIGIGNSSVVCFGLAFDYGGVRVSQTSAVGGSTSPGATVAFAGSADMPAMYNAYRIKVVKMKFMYNNNYSSLSDPTVNSPLIVIANDYSDVVNLTVGDMLQRDGVYVGLLSGESVEWQVVPKTSVVLQSNLNGTIYGRGEPTARQFVSMGLPFNRGLFNGTKFCLDTTQQNLPVAYVAGVYQGVVQVVVQAVFEMKHSQ